MAGNEFFSHILVYNATAANGAEQHLTEAVCRQLLCTSTGQVIA